MLVRIMINLIYFDIFRAKISSFQSKFIIQRTLILTENPFKSQLFSSKGERTGCTRASTTSLCGVATAHRGNSIDVGTWCWYQRCWRLRIQCIAFVQRTRVSLSHIVKRSNQSSCQVLSHHLLFYDENRLHNDCKLQWNKHIKWCSN